MKDFYMHRVWSGNVWVTFVIFLAELFLHVPATPGILTRMKVVGPQRSTLLLRLVLSSLCSDVNCSAGYAVKWGEARYKTVFPICQHLCEKGWGDSTTT